MLFRMFIDYKAIPIKGFKNEGLYATGKVDFEDYYREHADQLNSDYHPYSYANFSVDFLREISILRPDVDVRVIITYEYNDWISAHSSMITMYEWITNYRPELLEFFRIGINNG